MTITPAPAFAPLDLASPAGADWATNGGDYGQTRYSSLKEVTKANVRRLRPAWHIRFGGSGVGSKYKGEGTPLVYKGVMYTVTGANDVFAIDATDGTILWRYDAHLPTTITTVCCGWANRGARARRRARLRRADGRDARRALATGRPRSLERVERQSAGRLHDDDGAALLQRPRDRRRLRRRVRRARLRHRLRRARRAPRLALLHGALAGAARLRHVAREQRVADRRRDRLEHAERRPEARAPVLHDRQRVSVVDARPRRQPLHVLVRRARRRDRRVQVALPGRAPRHLGLRLRVATRCCSPPASAG